MQKKGSGGTDSRDTLIKPVTPGRMMRVKTMVGPAPNQAPLPLAEDRMRKSGSIPELEPEFLIDDDEKTAKVDISALEAENRIAVNKNNYFELEGEIGHGGMGIVYKARHVHKASSGEILGDPLVAVKQIIFNFPPEWPESFVKTKKKELIDSFFSEVKLAFKLQHPHIVQIKFFGQTEDDSPYYAMEYLEGRDLYKMLERRLAEGSGPLPWQEIREYVLQMCLGLEAAHGYGEKGKDGESIPMPIIHRDIKPENIFIADKNGGKEAKVLDFGLGKLFHPASPQNTSPGQSPGGTPEYMPQEQMLGWPTDHRTDIYSIGATLYHLLTGEVVDTPGLLANEDPYNSPGKEKWDAFVERRIKEKPRPMSEANPDALISTDLERIVQKCLERNPDDRYQSVAELRKDLESAYAGAETRGGTQIVRIRNTIQDVPPVHMPPPKPGPMKAFSKYLLAGGLATIIGIGGAYVLSRGGQNSRASGDDSQLSQAAGDPGQIGQKPPPLIPQSRPPEDSGGNTQPDAAAQAELERSITFRTGIPGVEVLVDNSIVCMTDAGGSCSVTPVNSADAMTFTLRKRGYETMRHSVVPDRDQAIDISMERSRPAPSKNRPAKAPPRPPPTINDQGDSSRIIIPPE